MFHFWSARNTFSVLQFGLVKRRMFVTEYYSITYDVNVHCTEYTLCACALYRIWMNRTWHRLNSLQSKYPLKIRKHSTTEYKCVTYCITVALHPHQLCLWLSVSANSNDAALLCVCVCLSMDVMQDAKLKEGLHQYVRGSSNDVPGNGIGCLVFFRRIVV